MDAIQTLEDLMRRHREEGRAVEYADLVPVLAGLKAQRDELLAKLEALTHYAECQVAAFSAGRPYLDMTLFPGLCASSRALIAKHTGSTS